MSMERRGLRQEDQLRGYPSHPAGGMKQPRGIRKGGVCVLGSAVMCVPFILGDASSKRRVEEKGKGSGTE